MESMGNGCSEQQPGHGSTTPGQASITTLQPATMSQVSAECGNPRKRPDPTP